MVLTGHSQTCADKSGGVRSISLARASAIENVTFDDTSRSVGAIALAAGESFRTFHFREDTAFFSERAMWERGAMLVVHEIGFSVDPLDTATARTVTQLAECSRGGGMVAIVQTSAGERLLTGYSEKFGVRQPLGLAESNGTTGLRRADKPLRTIVLRSMDDTLSPAYTGKEI